MKEFYRRVGVVVLFVITLAVQTSMAEVRLPSIFADNMVFQRDMPVPIWGYADPGEQVTVKFDKQKKIGIAGEDGKWMVKLKALKASAKPSDLIITSSVSTQQVKIVNVLVGEVWLCSGQSNMEMGIKLCHDAEKEIAGAKYPGIRLFMIPHTSSAKPQETVKANWKVCSPKILGTNGWGGFSAAAYFFGRKLHQQLNVPVGLIDVSWGGTVIEPWTAKEGYAGITRFKALKAGSFFNGMINPLVPFAIRGALWYQGESNLMGGDTSIYTTKMRALIDGWRKVWGQADRDWPFYYAQIAPFDQPLYVTLPRFWAAQSAVEKQIPNTGMIITHDITDNLKDIHPKNKQDVGKRFANLALHETYGRKDIVCRGPIFKKMAIKGNKIIVTFDNCKGGLSTRDGKDPDWFTIAGTTGVFVEAKAKISGKNKVTVWSDVVTKPVDVRLGWGRLAQPNLCNKAGLPVNGFYTDKRKLMISLATAKPVTTSIKSQGGHIPEDIVDGIADNDSGCHLSPSPQWLQVDLEKVFSINKIKIYTYYDGSRYYQYNVEGSTNGKTWVKLVDMSENNKVSSLEGNEHKFEPVKVRYVRVNMLKNSANRGVHLNELLVYEAE